MTPQGVNCLKVYRGRGDRLCTPMIRSVLPSLPLKKIIFIYLLLCLVATVRNLRVLVIHTFADRTRSFKFCDFDLSGSNFEFSLSASTPALLLPTFSYVLVTSPDIRPLERRSSFDIQPICSYSRIPRLMRP